MLLGRRICFVLFLCNTYSLSPVSAEEVNSLPDQDSFHLYLLVGQSNMAGRGTVEEEDRLPHPRVLTLSKEGTWRTAVDPIHFDKSVAGVGLGKTFGQVMAEANPSVTIGLIPCAVGGSPIASWKPGGYHAQTKSHPYDDCMRRARIALEDGTLKGILWHQGESDSKEDLADVYEGALQELIARFREELSAFEVPFVAGQMGQFPERPWDQFKKQVDSVHRSLPLRVAVTGFVSSDGLGHRGDKVHFDSAAYRELGRRYALEMQRLVDSSRGNRFLGRRLFDRLRRSSKSAN